MNRGKRFINLLKKASQGQDILESTPKAVPGAIQKAPGSVGATGAGFKTSPIKSAPGNLGGGISGTTTPAADKGAVKTSGGGLNMLFGKDRKGSGSSGIKYDYSLDWPKKKTKTKTTKSPKPKKTNSQYSRKLQAGG